MLPLELYARRQNQVVILNCLPAIGDDGIVAGAEFHHSLLYPAGSTRNDILLWPSRDLFFEDSSTNECPQWLVVVRTGRLNDRDIRLLECTKKSRCCCNTPVPPPTMTMR